MQDIWQALRQIGEEFSPRAIDATRQLYAGDALRPADAGAVVTRDLAYGGDPRQRLDVFHPGGDVASRPVVVFVHGGGFAAGDKGGEGAPFYNNVGAWAVRSGFVGVNMTYRLAPQYPWPHGAQDVALALRWVAENIGRYGGDAARVVVVGQSAGAAHVAGCLAGHGGASLEPAASVLLSGIYEPDAFHVDPMQEAYFGADVGQYASRSTVVALARTSVPCLFTISQFDPPLFQRQLAAVFEARTAVTGHCPELLWLPGHNHFSTSMQIGGPHDTLGPQLATYIRRIAG
jgi:acetyl esterase/lipase